MLYRVLLWGFSGTERSQLEAFLRDKHLRQPGYRCVDRLAEVDLIIANGDSAQVVADLTAGHRLPRALFLSASRPARALWHVPLPTEPSRLLLGLDELASQLDSAPAPEARHDSRMARSRAQALALQAVRHARLAAIDAESAPQSMPLDVLVLDPDDSTREQLCQQLEGLGLCPYPARHADQALWLLESHAFCAAFVDVVLDGSDAGLGVEVCRRVKAGAMNPPNRPPALIILARAASPVHRVRAALIGDDAFVLKPLELAATAGLLDSFGIALPAPTSRT